MITSDPSSRDWSYNRHIEHEKVIASSEELPTCYTAPGTVDNWRHERLRSGLNVLLEHDKGARWMTIGDGNYGSDAYYLQRRGADALSTSLTDSTLVSAAEKGFLKKYQAENAEHLSVADGSMDYTLCKEAYHHFPRPAVAFYEMVRVSGKAVVLIEPVESTGRILNRLKNWAKTRLRGDSQFEFEPCGNFIFRLSIREMEKMMTSLNGSVVAYKFFNDFYKGSYTMDTVEPPSKGFNVTKLGIAVQDLLCRLGLMDWGLVTLIAFTTAPSDELRGKLSRDGFHLVDLPKNPYL